MDFCVILSTTRYAALAVTSTTNRNVLCCQERAKKLSRLFFARILCARALRCTRLASARPSTGDVHVDSEATWKQEDAKTYWIIT